MLRLSLVFHASVLEPDFDLPFGEVQQGGDLNPPRPTQVLVEVELLLQLQQLRVGIGRAQSAGAAAAALRQSRAICGESTLVLAETSQRSLGLAEIRSTPSDKKTISSPTQAPTPPPQGFPLCLWFF